MTEPPRDAEIWQESLAKTVGRRVAYYRNRREPKLTAQQLSDQLRDQLGFDMKRAVIGNLETGLRRTVGIAEILAIAYVLQVPPLLLIFPGDEDAIETLPGTWTSPWYAALWFTGEGTPPPQPAPGEERDERDEPAWDEVRRWKSYAQHEVALREWRSVRRSSRKSAPRMVRDVERALFLIRSVMRSRGQALPPVPPELEVLDEMEMYPSETELETGTFTHLAGGTIPYHQFRTPGLTGEGLASEGEWKPFWLRGLAGDRGDEEIGSIRRPSRHSPPADTSVTRHGDEGQDPANQ